MDRLREKIGGLSDGEVEECLAAMLTLRKHLHILFHLMPMTTVERAIRNEINKRHGEGGRKDA